MTFQTPLDVAVAFQGPGQKTAGGRDKYIEDLSTIESEVPGFRLIGALGNDQEAFLMHELSTRDFGKLICAKRLVVRDGEIRHDRLTFDTAAMTKGEPS